MRAIALAEPRLARRFIARDGRVGGDDVTVHLPGEDEMLECARFAAFARGLADGVWKRFPGIDIRVTSPVILSQAFVEVPLEDLQILVLASFAAMAALRALPTGGPGRAA